MAETRKTAAELIDSIDERYSVLAKERSIDLSASKVEPAIPEIIASYAKNAQVSQPRPAGTAVLMTPVFIDGNYNRDGKKIRATAEEPIGKYQIFSREEFGNKALYFLTASGMIDNVSRYFRDAWNEDIRDYESYRPTEAELDEAITIVAQRFEKDLSDPAKWARYEHAAVLNRLKECDAHNVPVREHRENERKAEAAETARKEQEEMRLKAEKYNSRIDEIAGAMQTGKTIKVRYREDDYDGKNPVLDLFKLYGIELPLRTQGWVNSTLAEITPDNYRYFINNRQGDSKTFSGYLEKLRSAIRQIPIEQQRQSRQAMPKLPAPSATLTNTSVLPATQAYTANLHRAANANMGAQKSRPSLFAKLDEAKAIVEKNRNPEAVGNKKETRGMNDV